MIYTSMFNIDVFWGANCSFGMLFQWLAVPWLQAKIDNFVERFNMTKPHFNKRVVGPHGQPDIIFENPNLFDMFDFKVG